MVKKLASLLGKSFNTSKFKTLTNSAILRIAYLEKQHKIRCSQAQEDAVHLLNAGQQERALLRVEHLIREQNILDAYAMIENFCYLLIERTAILENNKNCPDELKEAVASLIFAASRCGELPEIHKIRGVFESRFGKEFATRAVELRNNCGVNPKIVKKLATRQPSLGSKLKALKAIAPANDISLQLEREVSTKVSKELQVKNEKEAKDIQPRNSGNPDKRGDNTNLDMKNENLCNTTKESMKYKDVGDAATAALKFAAHAADAARAAMELSRLPGNHPDSQESSNQERNSFVFNESMISELRIDGKSEASKESNNNKSWKDLLESCKILADVNTKASKARGEKIADNRNIGHFTESEELKGVFVENDDEDSRREHNEIVLLKRGKPELDESSIRINERLRSRKPDEVSNKDMSDENEDGFKFQVLKENLPKEVDSVEGKSRLESEEHKDFVEKIISRYSKVGRRPLSMRTRRMHRQ